MTVSPSFLWPDIRRTGFQIAISFNGLERDFSEKPRTLFRIPLQANWQ
jgi:hypothetical protein